MTKEILSIIAIILTLISFSVYVRSILKGFTKPHVFSWIIWSIITCTVFFAQLSDGAGAGAWPIGVSGVATVFIAILSYIKRHEIPITRSDWYYFLTALSAIPVWIISSDPLWAVIILTTVDVLGFVPTFRKSYQLPYTEPLLFDAIVFIRNMIAIAALENYTLTTVLFPAAVGLVCLIFLITIGLRRIYIKRQEAPLSQVPRM